MQEEIKHTFVVTAYMENEFLEDCVKSLLAQTVKSRIFISTSTPNEHICSIAARYSLELFVNDTDDCDITGNWNFAVSHVDTAYYTIAHQDDIYEPQYTEKVLAAAEKRKDTIIVFTKYYEIRNGGNVYMNKLLRIKGLMNFPLRLFKRSRFVRNRVLSLGSPICCPSVMYSSAKCSGHRFDKKFHTCCDWDFFSRVARLKGSFVYINKPLMGHRIYPDSDTTATIENGGRAREELMMFRRYWPERIAKRIAAKYTSAMKSNEV